MPELFSLTAWLKKQSWGVIDLQLEHMAQYYYWYIYIHLIIKESIKVLPQIS